MVSLIEVKNGISLAEAEHNGWIKDVAMQVTDGLQLSSSLTQFFETVSP